MAKANKTSSVMKKEIACLRSEVRKLQTTKKEINPFAGIVTGNYWTQTGMPWVLGDGRKAVLTEWFWQPIRGQPRRVDTNELRQFSQTYWVSSCVKTIMDEIGGLKWDITQKDDYEYDWVENEIKEIKKFLERPNKNNEPFAFILKALIKDILELDAGVWVKVFDVNSYDFENVEPKSGSPCLKPLGQRNLVELYARDGASFLKESDKFGFESGFWQYSYQIPAHPCWFNRDEVMYISEHPRSMSVYGYARTQSVLDIVKSLHYSTLYNKRFFEETTIPDGALALLDTNETEMQAFRTFINNEFRAQPHKLAIINKDIKWQPFSVSNRELEFLETQKWYYKMVISSFGLSPSEMGLTEDLNRSTSATQAEVVKRKGIRPFLGLIEDAINTHIIPEFGFEGVQFQFIYDDPAEKSLRLQNWQTELNMGIKTVNEVRTELGMEPLPNGDYSNSTQLLAGKTNEQGEEQFPNSKDDTKRAEGKTEKPKEEKTTKGLFECVRCGRKGRMTNADDLCDQCVQELETGAEEPYEASAKSATPVTDESVQEDLNDKEEKKEKSFKIGDNVSISGTGITGKVTHIRWGDSEEPTKYKVDGKYWNEDSLKLIDYSEEKSAKIMPSGSPDYVPWKIFNGHKQSKDPQYCECGADDETCQFCGYGFCSTQGKTKNGKNACPDCAGKEKSATPVTDDAVQEDLNDKLQNPYSDLTKAEDKKLLNPCCSQCYDGKHRRVANCSCLCHEGQSEKAVDKTIPLKELIEEHKKLVTVLESDSPEDIKAEAKKQKEELEQYIEEAKTEKKVDVDVRDLKQKIYEEIANEMYKIMIAMGKSPSEAARFSQLFRQRMRIAATRKGVTATSPVKRCHICDNPMAYNKKEGYEFYCYRCKDGIKKGIDDGQYYRDQPISQPMRPSGAMFQPQNQMIRNPLSTDYRVPTKDTFETDTINCPMCGRPTITVLNAEETGLEDFRCTNCSARFNIQQLAESQALANMQSMLTQNPQTTPIPSWSPKSIEVPCFHKSVHDGLSIKDFVGFECSKMANEINEAIITERYQDKLKDWLGDLSERDVNKVISILNDAIRRNISITQTAKSIEPIIKDKDRAMMIARTEIVRLANYGNLLKMKADGVEKVKFIAAMDDRSCDKCKGKNGQVYKRASAMHVIPVHQSCRCLFVASV